MAGPVGAEQESWVHDDRWLRTIPTQRRAYRRVQALLDAAGDLMEEEQSEAVTAGQIAKRARVRPSTFYHYFHGRQAVYGALVARSLERALAAGRSVGGRLLGRAPVPAVIGAAVQAALQCWSEQPGARQAIQLGIGRTEVRERLDQLIEIVIETDRIGPFARNPERWEAERAYVYPTLLRVALSLVAPILTAESLEDRRRLTIELERVVTGYLAIHMIDSSEQASAAD